MVYYHISSLHRGHNKAYVPFTYFGVSALASTISLAHEPAELEKYVKFCLHED